METSIIKSRINWFWLERWIKQTEAMSIVVFSDNDRVEEAIKVLYEAHSFLLNRKAQLERDLHSIDRTIQLMSEG
ncbi:hypothetical protein LCGC14_0357830 [marine sediment metagenome]|uniref:Uncharacterized protein n=1 Tax=marine sediment metagenome TaxID=412755 RepID=A0A0F9WGY7_9ZZZZ